MTAAAMVVTTALPTNNNWATAEDSPAVEDKAVSETGNVGK